MAFGGFVAEHLVPVVGQMVGCGLRRVTGRLFPGFRRPDRDFTADLDAERRNHLLHEDVRPSDYSVAPSSPRLVAMLDAWNVTNEERRHLYRTVAQGIPSDSPRKQRFMLLFVESYKNAVRTI